MKRQLSATEVAKLKGSGARRVSDNLYVNLGESGPRSWLLRYSIDGRSRWMGLGPCELVGLAEAREKARDARRLLLDGVDPLDAKAARQAAQRLEKAAAVTFKDAAERYIKAHRAGWKNEKHAAQWSATLDTYVHPHVGNLPVAAVDTGLVLKCLEPIWTAKPETAGRVRGRMESILDWAKVRGYREGENPARWRGHMDKLLPARAKVQKVEHHAALPYSELAAFMVDLRGREALAARALEFTILTAARTGETIGARWSEVDLDKRLWTIPAERMKAKKEHRVPLSERALALLKALPREAGDDPYVFPGGRQGKPLSNMGMLKLLERMGRADLTTHGFRSTFRDWAAERTNYPGDLVEMALAHAVGDKVEAAYRRGDMFDKRRRLMEDWARFCDAPAVEGDNVRALRG